MTRSRSEPADPEAATPNKHIVFDVVGTCVSYEVFFSTIERVLGPQLKPLGVSPRLLGFAWLESSEREQTYLSLSKNYMPFFKILSALFYRVLYMSGVAEPRKLFTDAQRNEVVESLKQLEVRPGLKEAWAMLREADFTIWCFTSGDIERVRGYFLRAGIGMPLENFVSCDTEGISKPELEAYQPVFDKFETDDIKWFAAAHMWDVSAAKVVGFRGAYCTVYEGEPCPEIFKQQMDVLEDTLPEMAKKIIAQSQELMALNNRP